MATKKEVLFISGEAKPDPNLHCDQEYRFLQDKISASYFRDTYYVTFLPNSLIFDIDKYLRTKPCIIHYCGHGNERGTIIAKQLAEERILWNSKQLKETLQHNPNLDLLVLCSCNSDKIIKELGFPAMHMIGFQDSIKYLSAKKFNELFYERLFLYGSALHAYIDTLFVLNRDRVRGIKPVCRSKINYVMKAVLDHQENLLLKNSELETFKEAIDFAQKTRDRIDQEIHIAEGRTAAILYELLTENPYAQEIIYVIDNKQQMADQVAEVLLFAPSQTDDREQLSFELFLLLEIIEKVLGSLRQMKYPKSEYRRICKSFPKELYREALLRLAHYQFPDHIHTQFDVLWKQVIEEIRGFI